MHPNILGFLFACFLRFVLFAKCSNPRNKNYLGVYRVDSQSPNDIDLNLIVLSWGQKISLFK